jgi:outer membrane protein OmpA-like peptidoglycan-associated protein
MASLSRNLVRLLFLGGSVAALAACAGTPQPDAALTEARSEVAAANNNASVVALAQPEVEKAQSELQQAEAALRNDNMTDVDHHAYLATRDAATAQQMAKLKQAQETVAHAPEERNAAVAQAAQSQAAEAKAEAAEARLQAQESEQQKQEASDRAQRMQRELAALQARQTPEGLVMTPRDIVFRTGSAELQPGADASIDRIAQFLRQNPDRKVLIEGFTDSTGTAGENQQLSEERADAVRLALSHAGVNASRIEIRGMGPAQPLASNDTSAGRLLNRRVRVVISNANGAFPQATTGSSQPSTVR